MLTMQRIIAEVQTLLKNAEYTGDGYTSVLTQDIEALQDAIRDGGHVPNEPNSYQEVS